MGAVRTGADMGGVHGGVDERLIDERAANKEATCFAELFSRILMAVCVCVCVCVRARARVREMRVCVRL
jgi:hypothetical protein